MTISTNASKSIAMNSEERRSLLPVSRHVPRFAFRVSPALRGRVHRLPVRCASFRRSAEYVLSSTDSVQHVARRGVAIPTLKLGGITICPRMADYCFAGTVLIIYICVQGNSPVRSRAVSVNSVQSPNWTHCKKQAPLTRHAEMCCNSGMH